MVLTLVIYIAVMAHGYAARTWPELFEKFGSMAVPLIALWLLMHASFVTLFAKRWLAERRYKGQTTPRCAGCDYPSLSGSDAPCPECGAKDRLIGLSRVPPADESRHRSPPQKHVGVAIVKLPPN